MLSSKLAVLSLLSYSLVFPLATRAENSVTTKTKSNPPENLCNMGDATQNNKADKHLPQTTNSFNASHLSKLETSPKELVDEVWQIVYEKYVDPNFNQLDWLEIREVYLQRTYPDFPQAYLGIRRMITQLDDSYTRFLTPKEMTELKRTSTQSKLNGQVTLAQQILREETIAASKIGKTAAESDYLRTSLSEHQLLGQIAQTNTSNSVTSKIKQLGDRKIGYIRISQFDSSAATQLEQAIKAAEAQQVSGYVLDLRSNPGGLLLEVIDAAKMFMSEGTIVNISAREKKQNRRHDAVNRALTNKPMTVLVNSLSASGTEIIASALKENNRATLVGEKTFGQGSIQSVHTLSNESGLVVTIAEFFTGNCIQIQDKGVQPQVVVKPSQSEQAKLNKDSSLFGSAEDSVYSRAIAVLRSQL